MMTLFKDETCLMGGRREWEKGGRMMKVRKDDRGKGEEELNERDGVGWRALKWDKKLGLLPKNYS